MILNSSAIKEWINTRKRLHSRCFKRYYNRTHKRNNRSICYSRTNSLSLRFRCYRELDALASLSLFCCSRYNSNIFLEKSIASYCSVTCRNLCICRNSTSSGILPIFPLGTPCIGKSFPCIIVTIKVSRNIRKCCGIGPVIDWRVKFHITDICEQKFTGAITELRCLQLAYHCIFYIRQCQ